MAKADSAMELHIWGPGFGLPSIDAECLAAIAYCHRALPPEQWLLFLGQVSSNSPDGELPSLHTENCTISGFPSIVAQLQASGLDLDTGLSKKQRARATALRAHLKANAVPLLDYALYTSSNYASHTKPTWRTLLQSVSPLALGPCADRYAAALPRTATLGLSSFADDASTDTTAGFTPQQQQEARMISSSPSLLFKKRQTVQAALKEQHSQTRFRLDALVDALLEPLDEVLRASSYIGTDDRITSIDCFSFGYLALLLYPQLSNNMVAETIRRRYPAVVQYTQRLYHEIFDGHQFHTDKVLQAASSTPQTDASLVYGLPYRTLPAATTSASFYNACSSVLQRIYRKFSHQTLYVESTERPLLHQPSSLLLRTWNDPLSLLITLGGPLLAGGAWFLYVATHAERERSKYFGRPQPKSTAMGAAGDLLSIFSAPFPGPGHGTSGGESRQQIAQDTPPPPVGDGMLDVHIDVRDQQR